MTLAVAVSWEVNWAVVWTWDYKERLRRDSKGFYLRPWGGWITYLSPPLAQKISPPPSITSETPPGGGLILIASEEPFDIRNPAHIAAADAIQICLEPIQS